QQASQNWRSAVFKDTISGYVWKPTASCDHIVLASNLSRCVYHGDAVDSYDRSRWCIRNPYSLWMAKLEGVVDMVVQLHALATGLPKIWATGRIREADKSNEDMLTARDVADWVQPIDWYLELVLFTNDSLHKHAATVNSALARGLAGIIASLRPHCRDDRLLKLGIKADADQNVLNALSLKQTGLYSPQNAYPVVGTSVEALISKATRFCANSDD